ncbi:MAG: hypothetical protein K8L91_15780 [Anaerolineae bacterium]|nr:hypothetical protein [Anaerolineae bacterium]
MGEQLSTKPLLDPIMLEAFRTLFFPRTDIYAEQLEARYVYRELPVTLDLLKQHLHGDLTLGTYALSIENTANWIAIDADQDDLWQVLIAFALTSALPLYLEQSRRGGHVWSFFSEPVTGKDARRFAKSLLMQAGFDPSSQQQRKIEIYPKQEHLETGKPGSLIRLPLGFHRRVKVAGQPGKRFGFQTPEGVPLAPTIREQLALLAYAERVPQSLFETMLSEVPEPEKRTVITTPFLTKPVDTHVPLSERIKGSISVLDFVSRYVELDGKNWGFCPFHDDQHKSFGVDAERNFWSCQAGCGGGSLIDFWSLYRERVLNQDKSFTATITDLAQLLGL